MKLKFRGWRREVKTHEHAITALKISGRTYTKLGSSEPLRWNGPHKALGAIEGVGLTGDFLLEFEFNAQELENWIRSYIESEPTEALRLVSKLNAEAVIAVATATQKQS